MRKFASLLTLLLLFSALAFGQNRTITGTVTDDKGETLPSASVRVKGTRTGVAADNNGQFRIMAKTGDILVVSGAGLETTEVTVDASSVVNFQVKRIISTGTEVIVTTLGQRRQTKELGFSLASVKASELTQAKVTNLQNGLTAKVSGMNIATTNNGVFADTRITLRGIRSLTGNNQPMLVVDGVPVPLGYLSSINPNDIADISILKSASGTAIYGPDGVNGAIIVTSKKGSKLKPMVTVSHTVQQERVSYMPKFQNRYGSGYSPDANGYGTYESIEQQSWGPEFDGSMVQIGQDGPNGEKYMVPYSYLKNERRNFYDVGITNQSDVSYAAGDFYVSAQNVGIKGTMPGDVNNRRTLTFRAEKETGKFKAGVTLRYANSQYNVTNNNQVVYYGVTSTPGHIPFTRFSDWRNDYFSSPNGYYTPYLDNNGKTPYFAKDNYREAGTSDDLFGNGEMNFSATSWLKFTYRVGLNFTNSDARTTRGAFTYSAFHNTLRDHGSQNVTSAVGNSDFTSRRVTSEVFATMNKKFNKFGVGLLVGQSYRESTTKNIGISSGNLGEATLLTIQLRKGEPNVNFSNVRNRLERYFGRLNFDFNDWAFLEATASYDFDSRLRKPGAPMQKGDFGFFYPGVSASFLLHEVIPGLKSSKLISYLKLRGAITKTGNVTHGTYSYQNTWNAGTFFPYGSVLGFQASTLTFADTYEPEFVVNKEVGAEINFLKNRISFETTLYTQDNTNQVVDIALSSSTGYTSARRNAASFVNKGVEFDLRLTPLVKIRNVNIDFKANYSKQSNKILSLFQGINELGIGNFNYAIVGQPVYVFKLVDYERDAEGHVIVDRVTGMPSQKSALTQFGRTSPTDFVGLSLNVNWKGLSFSVVGDYRTGGQVVADQLGGFMDDNGISERSAQNGRRAFVFPNSVYEDPANPGKYITNTNIYTQTYGRLFWNSDLNTSVTSNYLADGSFWKIREAALSYEIPVGKLFGAKFANTLKGANFGISGRNLFMWLPKSNQWTDPEFQGGNGNAGFTGNATGRSTAFNAPPTRIFGANLTLKF